MKKILITIFISGFLLSLKAMERSVEEMATVQGNIPIASAQSSWEILPPEIRNPIIRLVIPSEQIEKLLEYDTEAKEYAFEFIREGFNYALISKEFYLHFLIVRQKASEQLEKYFFEWFLPPGESFINEQLCRKYKNIIENLRSQIERSKEFYQDLFISTIKNNDLFFFSILCAADIDTNFENSTIAEELREERVLNERKILRMSTPLVFAVIKDNRFFVWYLLNGSFEEINASIEEMLPLTKNNLPMKEYLESQKKTLYVCVDEEFVTVPYSSQLLEGLYTRQD